MPAATVTLELASRMDEMPRVVALIEAFGAAERLPPDAVGTLRLVLEEAVTNVIRHGAATGPVRVRLTRDGAQVVAVVEDDGRPFDPLTGPLPPNDQPLEQRRPGGAGLRLMRQLMDGLDYRRERDHNILTLRKSLE